MMTVSGLPNACSHLRQNWGAGMMPCATPGCREGHGPNLLVMRATPKEPIAFWDLEPDLEDAVAEELAFRRGSDKYGSYQWKVAR